MFRPFFKSKKMKRIIKLKDRNETRWIIDDITSYYKENLSLHIKIIIVSTSGRDHLGYDTELMRDKDIERLDQHFDFEAPEEDSILP